MPAKKKFHIVIYRMNEHCYFQCILQKKNNSLEVVFRPRSKKCIDKIAGKKISQRHDSSMHTCIRIRIREKRIWNVMKQRGTEIRATDNDSPFVDARHIWIESVFIWCHIISHIKIKINTTHTKFIDCKNCLHIQNNSHMNCLSERISIRFCCRNKKQSKRNARLAFRINFFVCFSFVISG